MIMNEVHSQTEDQRSMPEITRDETRDKRRAILGAARDLFASKGYEETTIAEIARKAGLAVGTVYLYFENKHEIWVEVCLAMNEVIAGVILSPEIGALPLRHIPRAIIEASFRTCRENMRFMKLLHVEAQSPEEILRMRASKEEVVTALDAFFRQAIAQGQLAPFDTMAYAEALNNLVGMTLQQCFAIEEGEREEFYREGVIEVIERLFFGPSLQAGKGEAQRDATTGQ
jgi:AcrR family transcriptional regulator